MSVLIGAYKDCSETTPRKLDDEYFEFKFYFHLSVNEHKAHMSIPYPEVVGVVLSFFIVVSFILVLLMLSVWLVYFLV